MNRHPYIAEVAALIGDPARANILSALMGGQALTATELAHVAGVTPQTASGHLGKLTDGRLLDLAVQGRHRYYRLASVDVARMLEGLMAFAADGAPRHRPRSIRDDALAAARTCYDHLAGRLGVALADALTARGHLILSDDGGTLTPRGRAHLSEFGAILPDGCRQRRQLCKPCLDWSERRWHVGGLVGAEIARRCFELGWLERAKEGRAIHVSREGETGLLRTFGVDWFGTRTQGDPPLSPEAVGLAGDLKLDH
ncbi:DNA-binding transcriptional ArsR family regulator [Phenylobacterium haematophilum]|uniref:DNA-binding transcriptional ArsR family regulator n=1 Tax=Phenylobacterium haematophilum TaxID=98513 RepID=A0A839ZZM4_9CAUL|nr:helix-turn-helix transcriptional regulator [Phenylobacterium haematophilum]MBB3890567.1 DNA-binding transcriptional ArsR family regulator [Phenylobacterium haematophilum]